MVKSSSLETDEGMEDDGYFVRDNNTNEDPSQKTASSIRKAMKQVVLSPIGAHEQPLTLSQ